MLIEISLIVLSSLIAGMMAWFLSKWWNVMIEEDIRIIRGTLDKNTQ